MTAFQVGDRVVSRIDKQSLVMGKEYEVVDVIEQHLPFGTFVSYVIRSDEGWRYGVGNGHLVLGRVEVSA